MQCNTKLNKGLFFMVRPKEIEYIFNSPNCPFNTDKETLDSIIQNTYNIENHLINNKEYESPYLGHLEITKNKTPELDNITIHFIYDFESYKSNIHFWDLENTLKDFIDILYQEISVIC